ncbi:methyl-accepting chemotaxis protein [uncultured Shimia sp.]|uniref:methyl-accepting chemotaxis protein n=1 Tax=uncultured Shimia sp. TaxID=573152 RepID=UPI0025E61F67|nr:methyl-accepting chemotaxis protein [uncultured Shimia sp.]
MTLKSQILALIIIPLIALAAIGSLKARNDWTRLTNAQATQVITEDSVALLEVVHHLQVERGLSAVHITAADQGTMSELRATRTLADTAAQKVPASAVHILKHLAPLETLRANVTDRKIQPGEMGAGYSGMIAKVLSDVSDLLLHQNNAELSQISSGLVNLSYAKEAAGQQRAAGSGAFGRQTFDLAAFRWFTRTGAVERQLLDIANLSLESHFTNLDIRAGLAPTGLPGIREEILTTGPGQLAPNYTSKDWFERSTRWVSSLRGVENTVSDKMIEIAVAEARNARNSLILTLAVSAACLLCSAGIGWRLISTFTAQFSALQGDLDKLAHKEFDFVPANLKSRAEVGGLSRSMEKTRLALAQAEDQLRQIEETRIADRGTFVSSLEDGLAHLARGELDCTIEQLFAEEYESLRTSFNVSLEHLQTTIQHVTATADSINVGAAEISQSADHLSRRTESQAATLEETAAALEELTTSVQASANSARSVENAMSEAREQAQSSGEVVQKAVTAMTTIEESSTQIAQIIGVIDDIAFQTNLLALNAGVEAARAGDHGRGFAVVASEVRALAQKSAEAATEIKSLISESTRQVQDGVSLVGDTGTSITNIVDRVNEISKLISGIANGTVEQATGLHEINGNVHQLDEVTQKNAAMVEESTAAGHLLHADANKLAELMSQFRVDATASDANAEEFRQAS